MTSGIYCIKNSVDGKVYIGKSINIERRIGEHKRSLVKDICGKDVNRHLYSVCNGYKKTYMGYIWKKKPKK